MISMGLDPSATAPGLVVLGKQKGSKTLDVLVALEIPVPKPALIGRWERVQLIADYVVEVAQEHRPDVIVIEGYGQASHGGVVSFVKLVEVGTMIRMALHFICDKAWIEVPPTSLKKFVTESGKLPSGIKGKREMIRGVERNWGHVTKSHNVADAFGLGAFGLALGGVIPVRPVQLDAMDGVKSQPI